MELALTMALELVEAVWNRPADTMLMVDNSHVFPYLCNNVFLMRTDLYRDVVQDPRLINGGADEAMLNKMLAERGMPICQIAGSFGIHPAYSTHGRKTVLEGYALAVIEDVADRMLPGL